MTKDELKSAEGKQKYEENLSEEIDGLMETGQVNEIYMTSFIVQ
ncbi:flagellar basal body-associated FliL family protein [Bacillus carboniphilus]|uniref:Flagellar protein FliL n=1 Tax=Bacillus carboniphilus TaxID=86663 RepID=A0ABY9JYW1_9BACI|nr:flagellar basal body-associated FliL family protein [Bacillus carboniphilus]WLR43533.1 flagellar basal body-associated FliL family protein [Bacillus carboniphilus]